MSVTNCQREVDDEKKEMGKHGDIEFPIAAYDDDIQGTEVPWHWHTEWEMIRMIEGTAVVRVNDAQLQVQAGNFVFINTNALHTVQRYNDKPCRLHSVVFHNRLVGGAIDSVFQRKYVQPFLENEVFSYYFVDSKKKEYQSIIDKFDGAFLAMQEEKAGYELCVRENLSNIMLTLSEYVDKKERRSKQSERNYERVQGMLSYIHDNFANEITIDDIAGSVNISVSETLRCFKKMIGDTPIQYLRKYRLQSAKTMLQSEDISVAKAAELCGFHDMSYFSKSFKKEYGTTPSNLIGKR